MLHVDQDLFRAAQAGDRAALEHLLSLLQPDIHRYARFQCYASSSIEDVVQEALLVVYRRVGDIRSPAAYGGADLWRDARDPCRDHRVSRMPHVLGVRAH